MKKYLCTLTISISLFLIAGPVYAQFYDTPNVIGGNINECVSCGTGGPLEGVVVTIDNDWVLGEEVGVSEGGGYLWVFVPDGCYTLTFEKPGYTTVTVDNVCLSGYTFTDVCLSKE